MLHPNPFILDTNSANLPVRKGTWGDDGEVGKPCCLKTLVWKQENNVEIEFEKSNYPKGLHG